MLYYDSESVKEYRSQFHQHFTRAFLVRIFCQSQNVTRKAAKTTYSYEKFVRLTLMKLTPGCTRKRPCMSILFQRAGFQCKSIPFGLHYCPPAALSCIKSRPTGIAVLILLINLINLCVVQMFCIIPHLCQTVCTS